MKRRIILVMVLLLSILLLLYSQVEPRTVLRPGTNTGRPVSFHGTVTGFDLSQIGTDGDGYMFVKPKSSWFRKTKPVQVTVTGGFSPCPVQYDAPNIFIIGESVQVTGKIFSDGNVLVCDSGDSVVKR